MKNLNQLTKAWINLVLLVMTLVINGLGAFGFFNGLSQKAVSDMYATLITPAPFTFSIWSVIYTLLFAALIVMIIKHQDAYYASVIDQISRLFWLSCGLNMIWIVCFSYTQIGLATIFIFAFAIILALIIKQLGTIQTKNSWLLPAAFGMYAGWLLIATVVNTAAWLVKIEWSGFGISPEIWSVIVLAVAVGLTVIVVLNTKNAIVPIPVAWGYFGIYQSLMSPTGFQGQYRLLPVIVILGIILLIGLAGIQFYRNHYRLMPEMSDSNS
ncbi:MAG: tryptophan-rich sensory protein [Acetobacterium woodii]|nr:tryptophan-rich sensory protein [Acetobacterium woodii]